VTQGDLVWVGAAPLEEKAMNRLRRDLVLQRTVLWVPTGLLSVLGILYFLEYSLSSPEGIVSLSSVLLIGLIIGRIAGNQRYGQIRNALIEGLNVAPLLQQEGRGFAAMMFGMPGGADILDVLMRPDDGGALSKERDKWGRVVYKTRGEDPSGPAEGSGADTFDERMPRIDAMTPRPEFEGLEGELTKGEKLIEEANVARDEKAQKAWKESEEADTDLIEAGVEKLGDLVAQGHFAENESGEEFPRAPNLEPPNTLPQSPSETDEDVEEN